MSLGPENSAEEIVPTPSTAETQEPVITETTVNDAVSDAPPVPKPETKTLVPIERVIANRERIEREFQEVRRIGVFYGALLLPILILAGWCYHRKNSDTLTAELVLGSTMYVVVTVFAWLWRDDLRGRFAWPRLAGARVWLITGITPLFTLTCITLARSALKHIGWPIQPLFTPDEIVRWPVYAFYLWIGLCPAFFEEIAFRGLLLTKLKRLMTPMQAIWVTTLLFGILHFDILAMAIFLIPLAWIAGWLTHRTGSLWPAIIIHFVHNAGAVTLKLLN